MQSFEKADSGSRPVTGGAVDSAIANATPSDETAMMPSGPNFRRFSVAPMMDRTDRHFRYFARSLSRHALLYTEMVTTTAVLRGDRDRLLAFSPFERPLALQLGGSDPAELAECAAIGESRGFDEINLNVGCPSERVQTGRFGACLMIEPALVAECVSAMKRATGLPVTVKTRIGVDEHDSYEELCIFVERVVRAGCDSLIVHARKAWLSGLSPRANREIPPLCYEVVEQLKRDFGPLEVVLNGGISTLDEAERHLRTFDGVMLGRAAYQTPYLLADVDRRLFDPGATAVSRRDCVERMIPYIDEEIARGTRLHSIVRHMLGLFHGVSGGRRWRRHLSEHSGRPGLTARALLDGAASAMTPAERRAA